MNNSWIEVTNTNDFLNLQNGGITSPYPYDAQSTVSENPIKVFAYNGIYKIVNDKDLYYSPARYGYISKKDRFTFYQEATDEHRYASLTISRFSLNESSVPAGGTLNILPVTDKNINDTDIFYNVSVASGSGEIDDWVVSGPVTKSDNKWKINNFSSVPKSQVYIRHAVNNPASLQETRFTITDDRPLQSIVLDESLGNPIRNDVPVELKASAASSAIIDYYILSGPATLEGNMLTPTGNGKIKILAIAHNENNKPAKLIFEITTVASIL